MLDSFVRDFLVERLEMLLARPALRLQGGHLVHFVGAEGTVIASDTGWRVP